MTMKEIDECLLRKPIEPNTKYGYDCPITLCLPSVNVCIEGAKISTDENANPKLEDWDEIIFSNKDEKIIMIMMNNISEKICRDIVFYKKRGSTNDNT